MKYKNILLIIFFLTLFVFQQVQAGPTMPSVRNPSPINAIPLYTGILSQYVNVYMYKLDDNSGNFLNNTPQRCFWSGDFGVYGCGDDYDDLSNVEPGLGYMTVEVENFNAQHDYLRDVIATEMNVVGIPPDLEALKSQAVASRTVVSWKFAFGTWDDGSGNPTTVQGAINNTARYQAFAPGAYRKSSYMGYDTDIYNAVKDTKDQFLYRLVCVDYSDPTTCKHAIDAEFFSDVGTTGTTNGDLASAPYLIGVAEPISTGCVGENLGTNTSGMSQRGAIRWAKGQTCPEGTNADWPASGTTSPIKWEYRQILAHSTRESNLRMMIPAHILHQMTAGIC